MHAYWDFSFATHIHTSLYEPPQNYRHTTTFELVDTHTRTHTSNASTTTITTIITSNRVLAVAAGCCQYLSAYRRFKNSQRDPYVCVCQRYSVREYSKYESEKTRTIRSAVRITLHVWRVFSRAALPTNGKNKCLEFTVRPICYISFHPSFLFVSLIQLLNIVYIKFGTDNDAHDGKQQNENTKIEHHWQRPEAMAWSKQALNRKTSIQCVKSNRRLMDIERCVRVAKRMQLQNAHAYRGPSDSKNNIIIIIIST